MYGKPTNTTNSSNYQKSTIAPCSVSEFEGLLRQGAIANEGIDCLDGYTYYNILLPDVCCNDGVYTCYYKVPTNDLDEWFLTISKVEHKKYFRLNDEFMYLVNEQLVYSLSFMESSSETDNEDSAADELTSSCLE